MPKVPYPYEVNGKLVKRLLNTNLFLIKSFLIAKFDCMFHPLLQKSLAYYILSSMLFSSGIKQGSTRCQPLKLASEVDNALRLA